MTAYYNEIDEKAAAWLCELIRCGHIAPGDVDTRSISDVHPEDIKGYTQCHFFAGIGVWSYALRRAGWPDDRPVWTGSCPCQPFSAAGKGGGFADERHLWPAFHHLIRICRPDIVFGEQVASKDGLAWLDLVQADMEAEDYAFGAVDTCAAGFGAPHIRQRLYWMADAQYTKRRPEPAFNSLAHRRNGSGRGCSFGELGDPQQQGLQERVGHRGVSRGALGADEGQTAIGTSVYPGRLAYADGGDACAQREQRSGQQRQQQEDGGSCGLGEPNSARRIARRATAEATRHGYTAIAASSSCVPGPTNGLWRDADWLLCRDAKWRPVEPGSFPLAHGAPARMGRLRGYGNAINEAQAQGFIEAYLEAEADNFRLMEGLSA